jgi:hypothetical protein
MDKCGHPRRRAISSANVLLPVHAGPANTISTLQFSGANCGRPDSGKSREECTSYSCVQFEGVVSGELSYEKRGRELPSPLCHKTRIIAEG